MKRKHLRLKSIVILEKEFIFLQDTGRLMGKNEKVHLLVLRLILYINSNSTYILFGSLFVPRTGQLFCLIHYACFVKIQVFCYKLII